MSDAIDLSPPDSGRVGVRRPDKPGSPGEAKKTKLVAKAASLAGDATQNAERELALQVIDKMYEHVPPDDVIARGARNLAGAALSLGHFAARRLHGQAKIRVYNPDPEVDGWNSAYTIVEIVNDDMPFLVDSVTAAINAAERVVNLVIHPIVTVERDAGGRLRALCAGTAAGMRESWMQIEVTRELDPAGLARLTEVLSRVLGDVRAAVNDWPAMRAALHAVVEGLTGPPQPPVPPRELDEMQDFLRWLDDDNFTFLGYREYRFDGGAARSGLGILSDANYRIFDGLRDLASLPSEVQEFMRRRELLVITKSNHRATVHRASHMDAIGVRRFDADGEVIGIHLFLGLFTSHAYNRNPRSVPVLRRKIRQVIERSGLSPASHDGKALAHILDTLPRDELLQSDEDALFDTALGILNLQERQRIALFVRRDPLERFVSCLVYAPRERYDSNLRRRFAGILERAFAGQLSAFYTQLDDSVLARIQFILRTTRGEVPPVDLAALERELAEAGRSWSDRLEEAAVAAFGETAAHARIRQLKPFPITYQALTEPAQALADLPRIEKVRAGSPLEVSLHPVAEGVRTGLRLYRAAEPVVLSDVLPILENLGLRVVAEEPFCIDAVAGDAVWVHEFQLAGDPAEVTVPGPVRLRFEEALVAVWTGSVENDGLNRLILGAGLSARQVSVLRLYTKLLRQAGSTFSQAYMETALTAHPQVAAGIIRLFEKRFDPVASIERDLVANAEVQAIDHALDTVASLDEDRILRSYLMLILKSVRTNYFQKSSLGEPKPYLAVKLASHEIDPLPRPRPLFEIYVYSPRVEGVHMRAGRVARGGIRWSDRKEDFRTEILGLMKAQTVKNSVIVPVGAKGGFIVKRPPAAREQLGAEAIECYKLLIRGLLDLTDNIVAATAGGHAIEPPPDVVRHDDDDPYLVVAADKGTATFSDYANAIAAEYGFWLGDAFASGGSAGFDHKVMGITSRGAWELIKRHFRELARDIETAEISVVGVGDMSGDVFGNGVLMSRHLKLLGAFDHRHIFVDPVPDPEQSFAERERLFHLPRSSWADYDTRLISAGGGVFERSAKSIAASPELKQLFSIEAEQLTPAELIRKMLMAPVDLLWFGGIGTFIKARDESHAEVGDRSNDAVRVNADEIRAKVIGEGANLGVTERGRVAYAELGGHIDTDAIDNSAGVDTSDHEVNLKILIDRAIAAGALSRDEREPLLRAMTDDVAALVLRDNYLQGEALSVAEARGLSAFDRQVRLLRELEKSGQLDRALEFLPDDEELAERVAHRRGLTRPELAVVLAYAKLALDAEFVASNLSEAPALTDTLRLYFPPALRERLAAQIPSHPLKHEMIATIVTNEVVNRGGITFVSDLRARTGRPPAEIAGAYLIVREIFGLPRLWAEIEALDNKVAARTQYEMLLDIAGIVEHASLWLLRAGRTGFDEIARFAPSVERLVGALADVLPADERALLETRVAKLTAAGVPQSLALRIGGVVFLTSALEVGDLAQRSGQPIDRAARVFYDVGDRCTFDVLRDAARRLPAETQWQKAAVETLIDDCYALQVDFSERILKTADGADDPIAAWTAARDPQLAPVKAIAAELRGAPPDLAMLVVAARQLRQSLG
jgi:glutamate dehydrogenase